MEVLTTSRKLIPVLLSAAAMAAFFATVAFGPRPAAATPQYAAQTKLPCGQCHVNPAGGGALKPFGEKFKENGHQVK